MSQPIAEVPMAVMPQNHGYPTVESMTTTNEQQSVQQDQEQEQNPEQSKSLRLRGGAGCITDCLAAIGCCVVCEDCCC